MQLGGCLGPHRQAAVHAASSYGFVGPYGCRSRNLRCMLFPAQVAKRCRNLYPNLDLLVLLVMNAVLTIVTTLLRGPKP